MISVKNNSLVKINKGYINKNIYHTCNNSKASTLTNNH